MQRQELQRQVFQQQMLQHQQKELIKQITINNKRIKNLIPEQSSLQQIIKQKKETQQLMKQRGSININVIQRYRSVSTTPNNNDIATVRNHNQQSQISPIRASIKQRDVNISTIRKKRMSILDTPPPIINQIINSTDTVTIDKISRIDQIKYTGIILGQGKLGPVELIYYDNEAFALKIIQKQSLNSQKRIEHVKQEKNIMKLLQSDLTFVVKLIDTFSDGNDVCFVLEFLNINLFQILRKMTRTMCQFYSSELLIALITIHSQNVLYRDLKPENVMIDSEGHIKLIDFGFSKILKDSERTYTNCGTLGYTAPEIIKGLGHSFTADIWSFGILIGELLTGSLPFDREVINDPMQLEAKIITGDLRWRDLDSQSKQLLQEMLQQEPNLRVNLYDMMEHKFFVGDAKVKQYWDNIKKKKLKVPLLPEQRQDVPKFIQRDQVICKKRLDFNMIMINKEFESF